MDYKNYAIDFNVTNSKPDSHYWGKRQIRLKATEKYTEG